MTHIEKNVRAHMYDDNGRVAMFCNIQYIVCYSMFSTGMMQHIVCIFSMFFWHGLAWFGTEVALYIGMNDW